MPSQPLHPNLARIAAAYDHTIERYSRREINPTQARSDILALVAYDDNGTQWSIDPDSGRWCYRNRKGELVPSDPPSYGLATPTAHDLSRNPNAFNPDSRIQFQEVDETLLHPPNSLIGSTRRTAPGPKKISDILESPKAKLALLGVVVAALSCLWFFSQSEDENLPAPTPVEAPAEMPVDPPPAS